MKKLARVGTLLFTIGAARGASVSTNEIDFRLLRAAPESYKGKAVAYAAAYQSYVIAFLPYMEKSGFSGERHFLLNIGDPSIPVIARKSPALNQIIVDLKPGARVRVSGKVKQFRAEPALSVLPRYYVELSSIEVVEEPPGPDGPKPR